MSEILFGERNSTELMDLLNQETAKWGIVVENIELQNISLPTDIQRTMAAEAEAEKKSKARVRSFELLFCSVLNAYLGHKRRRRNDCISKLKIGRRYHVVI